MLLSGVEAFCLNSVYISVFINTLIVVADMKFFMGRASSKQESENYTFLQITKENKHCIIFIYFELFTAQLRLYTRYAMSINNWNR